MTSIAQQNTLSLLVVICGEWRLNTQAVQLIWSQFSKEQVDLFALQEPSPLPSVVLLTGALLSMDALAHSWLQGLLKYAFYPVSLITHTLCKVRKTPDLDGCGLLAHLDLVLGAHAPLLSPSLVNSPEEGPSF